MAVQTITYEDKQYLNQNADIPATNKVQDTDMNEIKSVVNNNANETSNNTTAIENLTPVSLYDEPTGSTTAFALSDTITNYKYIEIMAKKTDDYELFPTQKFYTNNQDNIMLLYNAGYGVIGGAYVAGQVFTISGTSVTFTRYYRAIVVGGQTPYAASSTTNVMVLKIIGYK